MPLYIAEIILKVFGPSGRQEVPFRQKLLSQSESFEQGAPPFASRSAGTMSAADKAITAATVKIRKYDFILAGKQINSLYL